MKIDSTIFLMIFAVCAGFFITKAAVEMQGDAAELACERNGVTGVTTMRELRKPGPYVVLDRDGTTIAIPKDGIRCRKVD